MPDMCNKPKHKWRYDKAHKQYWVEGGKWRVEKDQYGQWALYSDGQYGGIYPVHRFKFLRSAQCAAWLMEYG